MSCVMSHLSCDMCCVSCGMYNFHVSHVTSHHIWLLLTLFQLVILKIFCWLILTSFDTFKLVTTFHSYRLTVTTSDFCCLLLKALGNMRPDMEKYNLFTQAWLGPKLFYPKKCINCNKIKFATKQSKRYFTKSMSKIRLPHIYRGNNYFLSKS